MQKSIQDFIEEYVEGEPLTTDVVAWAIKKYIYINYLPTKKEEHEMYENLLHQLAKNVEEEQPVNVEKMLNNIAEWHKARTRNIPLSESDKAALENETFYNLCKLY